jgi:chitinase
MNIKKLGLIMGTLLVAGAANATVFYSWQAPYQGANKLVLTNDSNEPVKVSSFSFSTMGTADQPYGSLSSNAEITSKLINGLEQYTLTYAKDKEAIIPANGSADLTMSLKPITDAPFEVGMTVENITVNGQPVEIKGKCQGESCNDPTPGYRVIGYYTDWDQYARKYNATDIPINKANTINYAFIDTDKQGKLILLDPNADYKQLTALGNLQKEYPYLQTFLSFGGWSKSYNYSDLVADPVARANFVKNAVAAMKEVGFNGIDLDWEYPVSGTRIVNDGGSETPVPGKAEDAANFAALLTELRTALDSQGAADGKQYYLSIAVGAGNDKIQAITNADPNAWAKIAKAINYLNLMTYDFHGAFDYTTDPALKAYSVANFQAAMALDKDFDPTVNQPRLATYDIQSAVNTFKGLGFTNSQLILGLPAYGRMENVATLGDTFGLYQQLEQGIPAGEYDDWKSGPTGVFDYKCIVDHSLCGSGGTHLANLKYIDQATRDKYAAKAMMTYAYIDGDKKQFMSYDDEKSIALKTQWAKDNHFAGVMFWSFSGDLPASDPRSLVNASQSVLSK